VDLTSRADQTPLADEKPHADSASLAGLPPHGDSAALVDSAVLPDLAPIAGLAAFADEEPLAGPARPAEPPWARQPGTSRQRRQAGRENPEPVVRISIGRVEIRADGADAPRPRRQAARTRQPALELSEYLRRRDGRR
jgi:hypothetical protein